MMESDREQELKRQREGYAKSLAAWNTVFKTIGIYTPNHPSATEAANKMVTVLQDVLTQHFECVFQQSEGMFTAEDFFFMEESLMFYELLRQMEKREIESVSFQPGVTAQGLIQLCSALQGKAIGEIPPIEHLRVLRKKDSGLKEVTETPVERAQHMYREWLSYADQTFTKLLDEQTIAAPDVSYRLETLIDAVHQNPPAWAAVMAGQETASTPVRHSVDTLLISIFMGLQLNYDVTTIKALGMAALLHDLGRFLLPADFRTGAPVSTSDVPFIQLHAQDGASFLAGVAGLPMNVVRCALEHHIGSDHAGYPALPSSHDVHFFSKIIALADFVSWATVSDKIYHRPAGFHRRVRSVIRRSGSQFEPLLVKILVPFFGIYPPGTHVRLSTGEEAVVLMPNPKNLTRPTVSVPTPAGRWETRDLSNGGTSISSITGHGPVLSQLLTQHPTQAAA